MKILFNPASIVLTLLLTLPSFALAQTADEQNLQQDGTPDFMIQTPGFPVIAVFSERKESFALGCSEIRNIWSQVSVQDVSSQEYNNIQKDNPVVADLPCDGSIKAYAPTNEPGALLIKHRNGVYYRHYIHPLDFLAALKTGDLIPISASEFVERFPERGTDLRVFRRRPLSEPVFPIKLSSGQQTIGSHWYMETDVTVSNNGRIDGTTKTKSCQTKGFTGGVWVSLLDKETAEGANIIHITPMKTYGIDGKDPFGGCKERQAPWNDHVSADKLDQVRGIVIYQTHNPDPDVTKEDVFEAVRLGAEIYKSSQTGQ